MTAAPATARPPCADASLARAEPLGGTASRVEHWLLVEYAGYWPFDPLDATIFAGRLRDHLAAQLAALPRSRLLLVRRPRFTRRGSVRVVYGRTPERGARFFTLELEGHPDLLDLDVAGALTGASNPPGEPLDHPLLLVCTHGKRDPCCARLGRSLCTAVHRLADAPWVWQASHVGGDRFAGNLVCLPEGLYFGRLDEASAEVTLAEYTAGRIATDWYRGRSCYPFAVQAAELRVRRESGLVGFHDLRLAAASRTGPDAWTVDFAAEVAGDTYRVGVGVELGVEAYLTCSADVARRPRRFMARSCELLPAR